VVDARPARCPSRGELPEALETFCASSVCPTDLNLKEFDLRHLGPGNAAATLFKACPGTGMDEIPGTGSPWTHPFDVASDGRKIWEAHAADYVKATQRIYRAPKTPSVVVLPVVK
jgi:hypothetical protein